MDDGGVFVSRFRSSSAFEKKKIVRRFGRGARGRAIPTYRAFFGIRAR